MTANDAGDDLRGGRTAGRDEKDGPNGARLEEDAEDDMAVGGVNGYEAERARRIAANKARMRALGLGAGIRIGGGEMEYDGVGLEDGDEPARKLKRRKGTAGGGAFSPKSCAREAGGARVRARTSAPPARTSRRLRGYNPAAADEDATSTVSGAGVLGDVDDDGGGRKCDGGGGRRGLDFPDPASFAGPVVAPFTLASIGVTVLSLGAVHREAFAPRYWSSRGCLYHHAYPVGYRARKVHFGRAWIMSIEAGEAGPVFRVTDEKTGETFAGGSPTKPWTAVCDSKKLRTRISGPLYFGFSDPVTMRALAGLYTPEELQTCKAGSGAVASAHTSQLERCASELRALDGVGGGTAIALASTTQLSRFIDARGGGGGGGGGGEVAGRRLVSLDELKACVAAPGGGEDAVRAFLLENRDIPAATLRWPAWRLKIVPKIMAQLSGVAVKNEEQEEGEDEPSAPHTRASNEGVASVALAAKKEVNGAAAAEGGGEGGAGGGTQGVHYGRTVRGGRGGSGYRADGGGGRAAKRQGRSSFKGAGSGEENVAPASA